MRIPPRSLALAAALAVSLAAPAAAGALSPPAVTITDSANAVVPLTDGAQIANLDAKVDFAPQPDAQYYSYAVVNPDGQASTDSRTCSAVSAKSGPLTFSYAGNGAYKVGLSLYPNFKCDPAQAQSALFNVTQAVGVTPGVPGAGKALLTRKPGSFSTISYAVKPSVPVGTSSIDIQYARSATVNPDGTLKAAKVLTGFATAKSPASPTRFTAPGRYTFVARASSPFGVKSPWSAPQKVLVLAPFDLSSLTFPDSRGPIYTAKGTIREPGVVGKVVVALAKGKKGGTFRTIGKPTIKRGTFSVRFRASGTRAGAPYRIKATYAGSKTRFILGGSETRTFTVFRRVF